MRLLITGGSGFTGAHLAEAARLVGYEVFFLKCDLRDVNEINREVLFINPTHVVHVAGISHLTAKDQLSYYAVNVLGSLNLLNALIALKEAPHKVILASSSNVYGNNSNSPISEHEMAAPIGNYAMSKLAMEYMSRSFLSRLPILITRPFNYTGVKHPMNFVIPKIVDHFRRKAKTIELGDINVLREYNDVRDVCQMYLRLLDLGESGKTYNLATGCEHSLKEVIAILERLTGHSISIVINPHFVRANEIAHLCGDARLLEKCIGHQNLYSLEDTLKWMLQSRV